MCRSSAPCPAEFWGEGLGGENFRLGHRWPGRENHAPRGKHRTEVTEVTEESRVGGGTSAWDTVGLDARITHQEESIAQRSRRSQRESGVGGGTSAWGTFGLSARITHQGEGIAQRSRRSQRESGVGGETSAWDTVGLDARISQRKPQCTFRRYDRKKTQPVSGLDGCHPH
jgi:hypothetical protein